MEMEIIERVAIEMWREFDVLRILGTLFYLFHVPWFIFTSKPKERLDIILFILGIICLIGATLDFVVKYDTIRSEQKAKHYQELRL